MVITWLDFGGILFETLFLPIFYFKILDVFFQGQTLLLDISQEWLVQLMWNEKEVHQLDTG